MPAGTYFGRLRWQIKLLGLVDPFYQDARAGIQDVYVAVVPTVGAIFADGFESGDVSAWSGSAGAR